jgi:hypothetical protein
MDGIIIDGRTDGQDGQTEKIDKKIKIGHSHEMCCGGRSDGN